MDTPVSTDMEGTTSLYNLRSDKLRATSLPATPISQPSRSPVLDALDALVTSKLRNEQDLDESSMSNELQSLSLVKSQENEHNAGNSESQEAPFSSPMAEERPRKKVCLRETPGKMRASYPDPQLLLTSSTTLDLTRTGLNAKHDQFEKFLAFMKPRFTRVLEENDQFRIEQLETYTNTPIFTSGVSDLVESNLPSDWPTADPIPQYGLLGIRQDAPADNLMTDFDVGYEEQIRAKDQLICANLNVPWSAFICGSQGAGKSHTLSCLLESALVKDNGVGCLPNPLAGLVFCYDNYTNASSTQLCEAAYLCSSGIPVTVLVAPSNIWAMQKLYTNLPGLPDHAPRPKVLPLYLKESQLDITTILKLMAVNPASGPVPLYMEVVMRLLREMAMEGFGGGNFSYPEFLRRLEDTKWVRGQAVPLDLRLQLLESFLEPSVTTKTTRPASAKESIWSFKPGTLTIVDLSDPFVSSDDACSLFAICLSIFMEGRGECGRVVALDEAHKFLHQSGEAQVLTADLTSIIRQQRHTGTRVLIATQEPTLSPELIDLANATFVHRFLSPAWYEVLRDHLAGAKKHHSVHRESLFNTIVALETGEALLFCPTALTTVKQNYDGTRVAASLGDGFLKIRIRERLTIDGGKSLMATDSGLDVAVASSTEIPMHIVTAISVPSERRLSKSVRAEAGRPIEVQQQSVSTRVPSSLPIQQPSTIMIDLTKEATPPLDNAAPKKIVSESINDSVSRVAKNLVRQKFNANKWTIAQGIGYREVHNHITNNLNIARAMLSKPHMTAIIEQSCKEEMLACQLNKKNKASSKKT